MTILESNISYSDHPSGAPEMLLEGLDVNRQSLNIITITLLKPQAAEKG